MMWKYFSFLYLPVCLWLAKTKQHSMPKYDFAISKELNKHLVDKSYTVSSTTVSFLSQHHSERIHQATISQNEMTKQEFFRLSKHSTQSFFHYHVITETSGRAHMNTTLQMGKEMRNNEIPDDRTWKIQTADQPWSYKVVTFDTTHPSPTPSSCWMLHSCFSNLS